MSWWNKKIKVEVLSPLEGYNRWASTYAAETNPVKLLSDQLVEKCLPDLTGLDVLDAGCGTGKFCKIAETKNARSVQGIDLSPSMISIAEKECPLTTFECADLSRVVVGHERYDLVISALVMGHIQLLRPALTNLLKSIRQGGFMILTDFHPFQTLKNSKRTFFETESQRHFEVGHHLHLFEEYFHIFFEFNMKLDRFHEAKYKQSPVVFAMRLQKY